MKRSANPKLRTCLALRWTVLCAALLPLFPVVAADDRLEPDELKEIDRKVRKLVAASLPSTVCLIPGGPAKEFGSGSGVIVSEDGLILTAAHVTMKMNDKVTVIFPDGKRAAGKVLGMDYTRDSGMVQITDAGKYPFVPLGDSSILKENDWCVALGHSGGFDKDRTPPVRLGRVIDHDPKAFLMTDSALIGGDSGGPLFDIEGRLIGIHSNIGVSLSQNNHVPIAAYHENWERLKKGERYGGQEEGGYLANPDRPMIGAEIDDVPGVPGALVRDVFLGSPASKAGLKAGDTILKVGDNPIADRAAFIAEVAERKPGDELKLTVKSGDTEKDLAIKLIAARQFRKNQRRGPEEGAPGTAEDSDKAARLAELEKKLRDSIASGEMQLDPEDIAIFESPKEFQAFLDAFKKSLSPEELKSLNAAARPGSPDRREAKADAEAGGLPDPDQPTPIADPFIRTVLDAFRPSVARAAAATHPVFRGGDWKSLCTVVHPDGYAVTKASEIDAEGGQPLTVLLAKDRQVPAEIVKTFPKHDLALLRLKNAPGLSAIAWDTGASAALPLGAVISAAGSGPDAVAIGVVSVLPRSLAAEAGGFLGIGTAPHEKGVRIAMVLPGGAAAKAGLKKDDIILRLDGQAMDKPETLITKVKGAEPGHEIALEYLRGETETSLRLKLGDRSKSDPGPNSKMNRMGTDISEQRTGYQQALQTDLPIRPEECGGPIVDLEGHVIGLTIARAGRTVTYALPAAEVRQVIEPELKKLTAPQPAPASTAGE